MTVCTPIASELYQQSFGVAPRRIAERDQAQKRELPGGPPGDCQNPIALGRLRVQFGKDSQARKK